MNQQNNIIKAQNRESTSIIKSSSPQSIQFAQLIRQTNSITVTNMNAQQSIIQSKQPFRYQIQSPTNQCAEDMKMLKKSSQIKIKTSKDSSDNQIMHIRQCSDENESMDQVNSLIFNAHKASTTNADAANFSVTPDHFTVHKVHRANETQEYNSTKSENFPVKEIYYKPIQIQLPPPQIQNNNSFNEFEVDGIIPCVFQSIVQQKVDIPKSTSKIQVKPQQPSSSKEVQPQTGLNSQKKELASQSNKLTQMLLTKISQLEGKVKCLEQEKKKNQQLIKAASDYQSTPANAHIPTYGSIKKNNDIKKFSTVTQTQETYNSNYRVRSVVNKATSLSQDCRLQSNIFSLTLNEGRNENTSIKQQLNILKKKLQMLENNHSFNDQGLKNNIKQQNKKILKNNVQDSISSPSRKQLGGKIIKRNNSSSKLQNSPDISYRTQTEQSLYEDAQKAFVRTGPQKFLDNDSKILDQQKNSNIFDNDVNQNRKRIDSSAIFRKNPGPAIIQKNKFDIQPQYASKSNTLQFHPDQQKFIIMDSRQTQSLVLNKNDPFTLALQNNTSDIFIPELQPAPLPESTSEELIQIGKMTFKKLGCEVSQSTILNVKKFKNCVLFSISPQQSILWHYQGRFYYGGWKTFSNGEGQKNGKGVQYAPGKYKYKGEFKDGKRSGFGKMYGQNKTIYVGYWSQGFKHGKGKLVESDGSQYQGDWKFGKKCGFAKTFYNGKLQFEGNFQAGYKNGFGKQYFQNGDYYEGNYLNNKFDGKGSYLWASKALYQGQFKDGKRHGHGVWRSGQKNFDTYQGEYSQDNKNGFGVYKWANGATYKGSFKDDLKHGQGCITYQNGKSMTMFWNKGNMEKGLTASQRFESNDKKGNSIIMTPKTSFKKNFGTRSTNNLQSAKSLKSDRSLPKGISAKKQRDNHGHSEQKVQFRTKQHSGDFLKFKMSNDNNINRQLINKQTLHNSTGPLKDPPYKSMQTSANINMNV